MSPPALIQASAYVQSQLMCRPARSDCSHRHLQPGSLAFASHHPSPALPRIVPSVTCRISRFITSSPLAPISATITLQRAQSAIDYHRTPPPVFWVRHPLGLPLRPPAPFLLLPSRCNVNHLPEPFPPALALWHLLLCSSYSQHHVSSSTLAAASSTPLASRCSHHQHLLQRNRYNSNQSIQPRCCAHRYHLCQPSFSYRIDSCIVLMYRVFIGRATEQRAEEENSCHIGKAW